MCLLKDLLKQREHPHLESGLRCYARHKPESIKSRPVREDVVSLEIVKKNNSEYHPGTGGKTSGQVEKILFGSINHGPTRDQDRGPGTDRENIQIKGSWARLQARMEPGLYKKKPRFQGNPE